MQAKHLWHSMISHPILPSYNLKAEFLVDIPEENPAPEDVKRIMDTVQSTNLKPS